MLSSKKKIYITFIHNTVAAFIAEFGIFPLSMLVVRHNLDMENTKRSIREVRTTTL